MRAIAYLRVSTEEQANSRAGLDGQLDACTTYTKKNKLALVGPFADENLSGAASLDKRTGLFEAVNELKRVDILLVANTGVEP